MRHGASDRLGVVAALRRNLINQAGRRSNVLHARELGLEEVNSKQSIGVIRRGVTRSESK